MFAWLQEKGQAPPPQPSPIQGEGEKRLSLLALGDPVFQRPATPSEPEPNPPDHGVLVTVVQPGSKAAQSGIKPGDVLLSYGGTKLTKVADLDEAMKKAGGATRGDDG